MSKSERIMQKRLKRIREGKISVGDWKGFYEFLEAVVEETLEEKAKKEKAEARR